MLNKAILYAIILTAILAFNADASTPKPPEVPRDYVVDLAGILTKDTLYHLNASLHELEQKTTAQVLVLTVQSLDGQSIEEFSFNTKEKWKLGQKRKDNGVLLVVAVKDHKYRFEIGYGLESVLPDSLVGEIGRKNLIPNFRRGEYSVGINDAIVAVIRIISTQTAEDTVSISGMQHDAADKIPINFGGLLLCILALIPLFLIFVRWPLEANKDRLRDLWMGAGGGGHGSGGFGGGGFGGFGGGSFGGGGGGFGGGGGASGGW